MPHNPITYWSIICLVWHFWRINDICFRFYHIGYQFTKLYIHDIILAMSANYSHENMMPKLIKFIILLSKFKREEALTLLQEFSRESYYNQLTKLLEQTHMISISQADLFRERQINMQLKAETTRLNKYIAQEKLKKRPVQMTDHQKHTIQLIIFLEANDLVKGKALAQHYKNNQLINVFQELREYRWLKDEICRKVDQKRPDPIRFQSQEGEKLRRLTVESSSHYIQAVNFLKAQFHKITENTPLSIIPNQLFDESFQKQYESFVSKFRNMKNTFQDFQGPIKEKIINFASKHSIEIKQSLGVNECVGSLLEQLDKLFDKPQPQKVFYRRSMCNVSEMLSGSESDSSISLNSNAPSRISFPFKRTNRLQIVSNGFQLKMDELHKVLSQHVTSIPDFNEYSPQRKMEELIKKVKELAYQIERIKCNDEEFIKSFIVTDNMLREFSNQENYNIEEDILPVLLNRNSTDEPTFSQLKKTADRLYKELEDQKTKRSSLEEINKNLVLRIKTHSSKENPTFLDLSIASSRTEKKCKETAANLKQEIQALKEKINKLNQELAEKTTIITTFEISRNEERKRFEKEKQRLLDAEKARFNKMRDDYDDLMEQLANLGNLYQQRFLITQNVQEKSQEASFSKTNKDDMKRQIQELSAENQALKQQLSRQTHSIGVSNHSLTPENSSESSQSFIKKLSLESKILPSPNYQQLQDKISELEFKNQFLTNQIEKKDAFYNTYIDSQCSELKQIANTLSTQKQQLSSRLRLLEIRSVTHNEQNLPKLHLFPPGFIFEDHDFEERLFLLQNLQSYTGPIRRTRLLYRADPHNRTNVHKYIDKQRHIVAIFKTIYGKLIAGYSQEAFDASGIIRGHGMIMSLWGRKVFELQEKRAISYDDYFIIFGNSELRIKTGEFRLFSNFGIANAYYNCRDEKVHSLLGEDREREVDLSNFEVYALDLEE